MATAIDAEHERSSVDMLTWILKTCKCENKSEIATWAIAEYSRAHRDMPALRALFAKTPSLTLSAIVNGFSSEVILTLIEMEIQYSPPDVAKERLNLAICEELDSNPEMIRKVVVDRLYQHTDVMLASIGHKEVPSWLHDLLLASSGTRRLIELSILTYNKSADMFANIPMALPISMFGKMMGNTTLTTLKITAYEHYPDEFHDAVTNLLRACKSIWSFRFKNKNNRRGPQLFNIPSDTNLDDFLLEYVSIRPEDLNSILSTAFAVTLIKCEIVVGHVTNGEDTGEAEIADCLDTWAGALRRNHRIRELEMSDLRFEEQDTVELDDFVDALSTRPSLRGIEFCISSGSIHDQVFHFNFSPVHMSKIGGMKNLCSLSVYRMACGVLGSLLAARPWNIRLLHARGSLKYSKEDFFELLGFLSHPKCKLVELRADFLYGFDDVDGIWTNRRLGDEFIRVLRDKNTSLRYPMDTHRFEIEQRSQIKFWCQMNHLCPNRLKLRDDKLTFALADEIAKFAERRNPSAIYELVRSTFQNWAAQ